MSYRIDWEPDCVWVRFDGIYDLKINTAADQETCADPRIRNIRYMVWDLWGIDHQLLSREESLMAAAIDRASCRELQGLSLLLIAREPRSRVILEDYIDYARQLGIPWQFELFSSREETRNWVATDRGTSRNRV